MVKNLNYLALFVFALLCFALPSYANSNASFTLKEITHSPKKTIAYVTFETGVKSKAYIMYGTSSGRLNTRGPNETSFKYNTHRQVIRGLQPGETYYYRIFVTNQNGNTRESVIKSFTMAGEKSSFSVASAKSLVTAAVANLFSGSTIGITSVDPSPPAAD